MRIRVNDLRQLIDEIHVDDEDTVQADVIEKINATLDDFERYVIMLEEDNAFMSKELDELNAQIDLFEEYPVEWNF